MNYSKILKGILEVGEGLVTCGAENYLVEDSIVKMCRAYGFVRVNVFVIPSNIQVTVEDSEGEFFTQIRLIETTSNNFDRLYALNQLCNYIISNAPDENVIRKKYEEVLNGKKQSIAVHYIAGILSGTFFAVFFRCSPLDAIIAAIVSTILVFVGDWLEKKEDNVFLYNMTLAFMSEVLILIGKKIGIVQYDNNIMIGIVMLLISGIGIVKGIGELLMRDFISGLLNIMNSLLGALGIAAGIAGALLIFGVQGSESFVVSNSIAVQIISCTIACVGIAMWFQVRSKHILYSGIGAFVSWGIYTLIKLYVTESQFAATLISAMIVFAYAIVIARITRSPSTIFLAASVFPLVPGPNLYYMMANLVELKYYAALQQMLSLVIICFAIALGFTLMAFLIKILFNTNRPEQT